MTIDKGAHAHGFVTPRYQAVKTAFDEGLRNGEDVGAAFCMSEAGKIAVDLWGGWSNAARTRPWQRDTLVNAYSTTKVMTAMVAIWLADHGALELDAPVARYWPEFARNGKAGVKVRHILSHSAGLPDWHATLSREDLYDWEKATTLLAGQAPDWEPGTACGYHSVTYGYLVGEVVRRITGHSIGTVFREVFAEPLGADFHIGLPASEDERVAELIPPEHESLAIFVDVRDTETRAWRGAELPAIGGTGNARGLVEVLSILANGGVAKGKRFLSEAGARQAFDCQAEGWDRVLERRICWGLGFAVSGASFSFPSPRTLFWGGYGGSIVIVDCDTHTAMAYVMNRMSPGAGGDVRGLGFAMVAWEAQGLL